MSRENKGRNKNDEHSAGSAGWPLSRLLELLARLTFYAGLALGASLFFPDQFFDGFETPKLIAAQSAAMLALCLGALSIVSRDRMEIRLPLPAFPLAALFTVAAFSILWSLNSALAVERLIHVSALASFGVLAWGLYRGRDIRRPVYFIVFASGLIALWGLMLDWIKPLRLKVYPHFFVKYSENNIIDLYRDLTANQGNPNFLMHILVLTAPLCLGAVLSELAAFRERRARSFLFSGLFGLTFLIEMFCFFRSLNRSSLFGVALAFVLFATLLLLFHRLRILDLLARRWKTLVLLVVLTVGSLSGFLRFTQSGNVFSERAGQEISLRANYWKTRLANLSSTSNIDVYSRVVFLETGQRMIADDPFLGKGIGQFAIEYPRYKTPAHWEAFHLLTEAPVKRWSLLPLQAHNEFLQVAVELGLTALGLFLLFWLFFGWAAWGCLKGLQGGPCFYLVLGAVSGIAGCLLNALLTFPLQTVTSGIFIWSITGLTLAGCSGCSSAMGQREAVIRFPRMNRPVRLTLAVAFIALLGLGLGASWRLLRGQHLFFDALKGHATNLGLSIQRNAEAARLLPGHYEILFTQGWFSQLDGDTTAARVWYERTLEANPNFPETYEHLARLYYLNGNYARAKSLIDQFHRVYSWKTPDAISLIEGYTGIRLGDAEGLRTASRTLRQLGGVDPLMELAQAFQSRGMFDSCLAVLDTVKPLLGYDYYYENYPQVRFYEARVALAAGDTTRARAALDEITAHPSARDSFLVEQSNRILGTLNAK